MNFVDAAVSLLREAEAPLHVEDLCRLALDRGLLDSPGANPLRSFKGRLTTELKRGEDSRVVRLEDDIWTLSDVGRDGGEIARGEDDELEPALTRHVAHEGDGPEDEDEADIEADKDFTAGDEDEMFADDGRSIEEDREPLAVSADIGEDAEEVAELAGEDEGLDRVAGSRELSPEEAELVAVYGDETGTAQVGALSEYRDEQTADEDRRMVPEMTGERRGRREREDWKTRRERIRRERREKRDARERERETRQGGNGSNAAAAIATPATPAVELPAHHVE